MADLRAERVDADPYLGTLLRDRGWVDFADDGGRIGDFQGSPGGCILLWTASSPRLGEGSMPTLVSVEPDGVQVLFAFCLGKTAQIGMRFTGCDDLLGVLNRVEAFRAGDPPLLGCHRWGGSDQLSEEPPW